MCVKMHPRDKNLEALLENLPFFLPESLYLLCDVAICNGRVIAGLIPGQLEDNIYILAPDSPTNKPKTIPVLLIRGIVKS